MTSGVRSSLTMRAQWPAHTPAQGCLVLFISCNYSRVSVLCLGLEDPESPAHVLCALQTTVCSSAITFMPWPHHDSLFLVAQLSMSFGAQCDSFLRPSLGRRIGSRPGFNLANLVPRGVVCGSASLLQRKHLA